MEDRMENLDIYEILTQESTESERISEGFNILYGEEAVEE